MIGIDGYDSFDARYRASDWNFNTALLTHVVAGGDDVVSCAYAEKYKKAVKRTIEVDHGQRLDTRTPSASGADDSELEAVEKKHRPAQ